MSLARHNAHGSALSSSKGETGAETDRVEGPQMTSHREEKKPKKNKKEGMLSFLANEFYSSFFGGKTPIYDTYYESDNVRHLCVFYFSVQVAR